MKCIVSRPVKTVLAKWLTLIIYIISSFGSMSLVRAQSPFQADSVFYNGNILTVDSEFKIVEAFAIWDDKFIAVGTNDEVLKLAGSDTKRMDLKGKTVLPGFADGHAHILPIEPGVNAIPLYWPKDINELIQRISKGAKQADNGDWLTFTVNDWHPSALKEKRFPTRWELDQAAPDNPVYLLRGGQTVITNSLGLEIAGIKKDTQPPEGMGVIEKDPKSGEPTGLLLSNAMFLLQKKIPKLIFNQEQAIDEIVEQSKLFNAAGVTSVRDAGLSPEQIRAFQEVYRRGLLSLRVNMMYQPRSRQEPLDKVLEQIRNFGPATDLGDEWLSIGGLKLHIDGAVESAYLKEPYPHAPTYHGLLNYPPEKFRAILKEAHKLGWSVGVHTVGDKAVELVLDAFEAIDAEKSIKNRRWALEHAMFGTEHELDRIERLGVVMSEQEWTFYQYSYPIVQKWGMERAEKLIPIKTWLENGIRVAGGVDHSPTQELTNIQFLMLWVAVTRNTEHLGILGVSEKISREDAIRLHTHAPAYLTFEEDIKGTIEVGKLADFIVISDNILTIPEHKIPELEVLKTFIGANQVYSK